VWKSSDLQSRFPQRSTWYSAPVNYSSRRIDIIMPSIKIPTPLRVYTGSQAQVEVSGATIGEALADLTAQYPELRPHIFNGDTLRSFVNVFVGEDDIRFLNGLDTDIEDDDAIRIIPSIAGGA
jgi:adenylyltransferase/sulfurtransferase